MPSDLTPDQREAISPILDALLRDAMRATALAVSAEDRTIAIVNAKWRAMSALAALSPAQPDAIAAAEARAYELAVAIMGGEDAPGYADSVETEVLVEQIRKERRDRDAWTDSVAREAEARGRREGIEAAAKVIEAAAGELAADDYQFTADRILDVAEDVRAISSLPPQEADPT